MIASFFIMDNEMKGCLTQLEEKIVELVEIISRLMISLAQALATPIVNMSPMFGDEDSASIEEDE